MKIKLSVVIPCYNHGKYLPEALASVDKSSNRDEIEVIIVNDGSDDELTNKYIASLDQSKYVIINQGNLGLAKARNNGIRIAKGGYILPLDSDNIVLNSYLFDAIEILDKDRNISVVYGNREFFGEKKGVENVGKFNLQRLMLRNYIDACAVFRKKCWEEVGGYDEKMPCMGLEDWDFWLNLAFSGKKFYYVNSVCFNYRVLSNSMINSINKHNYEVLDKYVAIKYVNYLDYDLIVDRVFYRESTNYNVLVRSMSFKTILYVLVLKVFMLVSIKKFLSKS